MPGLCRASASQRAGCLLRIRAHRRFAARVAENDEEPLPGLRLPAGLVARRDPPAPVWIDTHALRRIGRATRLLHLVENEVAAGAQHDDSKACRNECAHEPVLPLAEFRHYGRDCLQNKRRSAALRSGMVKMPPT